MFQTWLIQRHHQTLNSWFILSDLLQRSLETAFEVFDGTRDSLTGEQSHVCHWKTLNAVSGLWLRPKRITLNKFFQNRFLSVAQVWNIPNSYYQVHPHYLATHSLTPDLGHPVCLCTLERLEGNDPLTESEVFTGELFHVSLQGTFPFCLSTNSLW